jgi:hypothetical protein
LEEITECPLCAKKDGFKHLITKYRQGIDVEIPCDFDISKINDCKLIFVEIPYLIVECKCCCEKIKIIPSFLIKGTRLTLSALTIVSIFYHTIPKESWRSLNEKICYSCDNIAHTTLYRGYHALGKNLKDSKELLKEILNNDTKSTFEEVNNIHQKARKKNTKIREKMVIKLFLMLLLSIPKESNKFLKKCFMILENLVYKIILYKIFYPKRLSKATIDSS